MDLTVYNDIRSGGAGFYEQKRGLIAVWGKEAIQFLDGLITNNVKNLADGEQMLAAFPNAQGRLLAVVRVRRQGEEFLFETEEATRIKVYENLFRFTFAGDFSVEDRSDKFSYFEIFGSVDEGFQGDLAKQYPQALAYKVPHGAGYFVPTDQAAKFRIFLADQQGCVAIDDELYETLRIETGIPKYGVDMDENTIVPELSLDGMISYSKGCYIGQEIIARIHFRGHVAKQLTRLVSSPEGAVGFVPGAELVVDDKNAGRITSTAFSPKLDRNIALAFVRYDHLSPGVQLSFPGGTAMVIEPTFVK